MNRTTAPDRANALRDLVLFSRLKRRKEALQLNSFVTGRKLPFDVDGGEDRVIAELRSRLHVLVNPENLREFNYRWAL